MQRKQGFPVANCNIKMPDCPSNIEGMHLEDECDQQQKRQQLINFGHSQWGFNNWSWSVTKQELDFVDFTNGKYAAGVVAFVSVTVKSFDIHRENIGYATSLANNKGFAIYKSRKCAVTNALRETILSFGGAVATDLMEILESAREQEPLPENNPGLANNAGLANNPGLASTALGNKPVEPINARGARRNSTERPPLQPVKNAPPGPMPPAGPLPPANRPPARAPRPPCASNVSFVVPVMGGLYGPPRLPPPPPHVFPNYYDYGPGWHFYESYDRAPSNLNVNFNLPPKNLMVNKPPDEPMQFGPPPQSQPCWIKPTIFYDGFWTEQKVKKWVAEQVEKRFPEDLSSKAGSPLVANAQPDAAHKP